MTKNVTPSVKETAFSCPHCAAFTTQFWFILCANRTSEDSPIPFIPTESHKGKYAESTDVPDESKKYLLEWFDKMLAGLVFVESLGQGKYCANSVSNLFLSKCYNCKKCSVWVHDRLLFPSNKASVQPNADLPDDIIRDFEEAREIVDASPRGAAALLRLCIQKLCKHLGETGKNIDDDIGSLVQKGLHPLVQQSLDVVRVVGNEAVHPGILDLKDDRETAVRLFELVNAIAEQMISHPKAVKSMYEKLPQIKRDAIEKRDGTRSSKAKAVEDD